jgi:hypothetical protein
MEVLEREADFGRVESRNNWLAKCKTFHGDFELQILTVPA